MPVSSLAMSHDEQVLDVNDNWQIVDVQREESPALIRDVRQVSGSEEQWQSIGEAISNESYEPVHSDDAGWVDISLPVLPDTVKTAPSSPATPVLDVPSQKPANERESTAQPNLNTRTQIPSAAQAETPESPRSQEAYIVRSEEQLTDNKQPKPAIKAPQEPTQRVPALPSAISVHNIDMFVGELRVLGQVKVDRVATGNGGIIRVEVLKTGELLVIGESMGSSSLRLWNKDGTQTAYNIRVSENDPETRFRMERMVRLRVRMVEFRKSALGKLGIEWGSEVTGPTFATAGDAIGNNLFRPAAEGFEGLPNRVMPFSTYFGIASSITSKINIMSNNGDAVTLAEPVLSAINGGQASFLAGGEVPYPSVGTNGNSTVEFKEYGIRLNIAPRIDAGGNVRTLVETEISQIDAAVSVNGTPGLLTRRAQTEVNVRSGETIVISGLLSSENSLAVTGVPGLRHLPIIGRFFRSENKASDVRELVIFVTPEIIDPNTNLLSESESLTYERSTEQLSTLRKTLPLME